MSLTREDMLRELELLPAWRVRVPTDVLVPVTAVVQPAAEQSLQALPLQPLAPEAAGMSVQSVISTPALMSEHARISESPAEALAARDAAEAAPVVEQVPVVEQATVIEQATALAAVAESAPVPLLEDAAPRLETPWLLYAPQAADVGCQTLLENIMRALALPTEQVVLHQQPLRLSQVAVRYCLLFGLEAANQFLHADYASIATARGQVHSVGDTLFVITHAPQVMLDRPALKREVWQDICLLLARHAAASA